MPPIAGQLTLLIYAVLLAAGGAIGYAKAGSKASLIAGSVSAILIFLCGLFSIFGSQRMAFILGATVTAALVIVFAMRFAKSRKVMPGGMMSLISLAALVFLVAAAMTSAPVE
jgi:uncharacterized membrane protein (UPF0136 family)